MTEKHVTFVVFGGTGDLTKRKLVPALSAMVRKGVISKHSLFIGIARGDLTSESYKQMLLASAVNGEAEYIKDLSIHFFRGDASNIASIKGLSEFITKLEAGRASNRVFYLATSFKLFPDIVSELAKQKLHTEEHGFSRIVFEKPFGENLRSSDTLNRHIKRVFNEEQTYRIDHYLAKETVQNVLTLKASNPWFDALLDSSLVESIDVVVDEELGVGSRLEYYNEAGALKDMLQNHLLQVLSLVLMEAPEQFTAETIHTKKLEMLSRLRLQASEKHLLGQYQSYAHELKGKNLVDKKTETFARIALTCEHPRWKGTKITLRTGKKLARKSGQISINFKPLTSALTSTLSGSKPSKLLIDIYPNQDVTIVFNTRKPGSQTELEQAELHFAHTTRFGPNTTDEYATLLGDVLEGDRTLFTRYDELRASWMLLEQIETIKARIPFVIYADGSDPEKIK